jgi:exodeoxyribonuclease V alpha subunit
VLAAALDEYFPDAGAADQRQAAELACRRWTSVITGGPGTGKTTTIARLLGVLLSLEGQRPLRVALAAPTGKAAARMTESLREATEVVGFPGAFADRIRAAEASTLHRLLGWRSESSTRFRHDRSNPLPYDLVVVDETSMVSLTLMARLLEAMRPGARLVLVGDADQLASVEAGAVLGDLVRGWRSGPVRTLGRTHRFGKNIAELAEAINAGDDDEVVAILRQGRDPAAPEDGSVAWVQGAELDPVLRDQGVRLWEAGRAGDGVTANEVFESHRLLCAHRDGPAGASWWNRHVERLVMAALGQDWLEEWYPGRPFIVNANDRGVRLWNGDTGVVCLPAPGQRTDGPRTLGVLGTGGGGVRALPTTRLADITTAHAMTVHRSQGSQFDAVTVLLPEPDSRILTRELLYTAVTRARSTVRVVGTEEAVRAAVTRRARRATGLERRLTSGDVRLSG